jgi:hypothetical protein
MLCQKLRVQTGHGGEQVPINHGISISDWHISNWQAKHDFVGKFNLEVGKEVTLAIIYLKYSED